MEMAMTTIRNGSIQKATFYKSLHRFSHNGLARVNEGGTYPKPGQQEWKPLWICRTPKKVMRTVNANIEETFAAKLLPNHKQRAKLEKLRTFHLLMEIATKR